MHDVPGLNAALEGRYAIEREIGRGGMATVFLARDVRHDRRVAIKFLDPELGAERFLSEIRVTANLQHPHLLSLFDSGEVNGQLYYVMPFIDGETLRTRLDREKQFGIEDAVRITVEVADALEYAHQHGVIHRDLKPENVLLQSGHALVADFGIALAVSNAGGQRVTQTGLSLGTPQYMSPEQATGDRIIDGRADIYSLAAVAYEMLVGEAPHTGKSVQAIIARVITERPRSIRIARETVPEHIAAAVEHALAKLPADRFATAREFADALRGRSTFAMTSDSRVAQRHHATGSRGMRIALGTALAVAVLSATAAVAIWRMSSAPQGQPAHFTLTPQPGVRPTWAGTWGAAISADGSLVVFTGTAANGTVQLYSRRLNELSARGIPGTERASQQIISPDGKWLAFISDGKLRKVKIEGGTPVVLTDLGAQNGADWVGDQIVVGAERAQHGLLKLPASGGTPVAFTKIDPALGEADHLWPVGLDDDKTILFATWDGKSKQSSRLAVTSLTDGVVTRLGVPGIAPLGVVSGHLIYIQIDGTIMALPFDVRRRRVTGTPVPVGEPVLVCAPCNGDAGARLSKSGVLVSMKGSPSTRMILVDRSGKEQSLGADEKDFVSPVMSPDGRRIAVGTNSPTQDVWLYDIPGRTLSRVTTGSNNLNPFWAPDGRSVYFTSDRSGAYGLWRQTLDAVTPPEAVTPKGVISVAGALSPDGKSLAFMSFHDNVARVDTMSLGGGGVPKPFVSAEGGAFQPAFSPDGRWLAYSSLESGSMEVYVRGFPGRDGGRIQVSTGGGFAPRWSSDGRRIAYFLDGRVVLATITTTPTFAVVSREPFFDASYTPRVDRGFDLTADGLQLLTLRSSAGEEQVVVMTNWAAEVRAKTAKR